jgi:hypothetical protein
MGALMKFFYRLSLLVFLLLPTAVFAQAPAEAPAEVPKPPFRSSLLFSDLEVDTIRKALEGRAVQSTKNIESVELIPIDRKIWLQGIYYQSENNWIIWMNGYKLTPHYLLPEIRAIQVKQDRVYLEWYDIGKNGIIRLMMQPHQVYDIVTGIMVWDTDGGRSGSLLSGQ